MHKLYELKDMLMEQLEKDAGEELNSQNLKEIDMLAHATKNLCKVIEACEDDERYSGRYYARDYDYSGRRDSMGRYARDERPMDTNSYDGGMRMSSMMSRGGNNEQVVQTLEHLMETAGDERTRGKFRELIRDMRNR